MVAKHEIGTHLQEVHLPLQLDSSAPMVVAFAEGDVATPAGGQGPAEVPRGPQVHLGPKQPQAVAEALALSLIHI